MNNPNPFVPKGSLLEQQNQRRSRLKITVGCVVVVSSLAFVALLIQGCGPSHPPTDSQTQTPDLSSNATAGGSALPPIDMSSNGTSSLPTNLVSVPPPAPVPLPAPLVPPAPPVPEPAAGTDYIVVAGDTLSKIAKAHNVTLKALEAANPGVDSKKLKLKQKLTIPGATAKADATATSTTSVAGADAGGEPYTVKSGDNLGKIAKKHGVSIKALRAANNLTTDHIKVGQALKIPVKGETATTVAQPTPDTTAPPMVPTPAPMPAPGTSLPVSAPGH